MTLINKIEEVLVHKFNMGTGSAITQAVAFVIFHRNSRNLVNGWDDPLLGGRVSKAIVLDGIKHVKEVLADWESGVMKMP